MDSLVGDMKEKLDTKKSNSELSIEERIELLKQARNYVNAKAATLLESPNRPRESAAGAVEPNLIRPCTSYVLSRDEHLESNVEHWITNTDGYEDVRRLRRDATMVLQQSNLVARSSRRLRALASLWYIQYMLTFLPLMSLQRHAWCSPRNSFMIMLNAVEGLAAWLKGFFSLWLTKISELNIDQVLYEGFVILIDIVLGLHAIVILLVSFYQQQAY